MRATFSDHDSYDYSEVDPRSTPVRRRGGRARGNRSAVRHRAIRDSQRWR